MQKLLTAIGLGTCVALGTVASLNPSVNAVELNRNSSSINEASNSSAFLVAQRTACPGYNPSEFVRAETKNFFVYICGGDLPHTYVGIAKNGRGNITLPLRTVENDRFVAVNGNHRYTLTRNKLTVTRNGRTIVNEAARWIW